MLRRLGLTMTSYCKYMILAFISIFLVFFITSFNTRDRNKTVFIDGQRKLLNGNWLHNRKLLNETLKSSNTAQTGQVKIRYDEKKIENCSRGKELVGPLYVDRNVLEWDSMKEELNFVRPGGFYTPEDCRPIAKTAIIIPYRDRAENLKVLLRQLHPILRRQQLHYQIFVIEQADENLFNRGKVMNVGFKEALKYGEFNCFVFHDVDLIPEDDRNYYGCNISPAHMSVAVDKFNYQLLYSSLFGGIVMFSKENFLQVNGFSNKFWGWGAEDDDMYRRVLKSGLVLKRPAIDIARYTMVNHEEQSKSDLRHKILKNRDGKERSDGLNSLQYTVKDRSKHQFHTMISVNLLREKDEKDSR